MYMRTEDRQVLNIFRIRSCIVHVCLFVQFVLGDQIFDFRSKGYKRSYISTEEKSNDYLWHFLLTKNWFGRFYFKFAGCFSGYRMEMRTFCCNCRDVSVNK